MGKKHILLLFLFPIFFLSGCLYPEEKLTQNEAPNEMQVRQVQEAVNEYQKDNNGLLPIKTTEKDTQKYQKFPVDFKKLVPKYLPEYPSNSFEGGGVFVYVLIDEETKPLVRLFDARLAENLRDVNLRLLTYIEKHDYPPYKDIIADGIYSIDYKKMKMKAEPSVVSPFTNNNLPLLINNKLQLVIDYRSDVYQYTKNSKERFKKNEDVLHKLAQDSLFVPAFSEGIYLDDAGEPTYEIGK